MSKNSTAKTHREIILKYINEEGGLSTLVAREQLGIMSPAPRVFELREDGYPIATVEMTEHDVTGTPHKIAKYIMLMGELANSHPRHKQTYQLRKNVLSEQLEQKAKKEAATLTDQDKESGHQPNTINPTDDEGDSQIPTELDE